MSDTPPKLRVLFLCTGNSCRSQMAEGWARHLKADVIDAHSAGTQPHGLNRLAVQAMAEAGVDISRQTSKHASDLTGMTFDWVVTVCDAAHESCPIFPSATRVVHVGFDDPPRLAAGADDYAQALPHYRRVRDEIRVFIMTLPDSLNDRSAALGAPLAQAAAARYTAPLQRGPSDAAEADSVQIVRVLDVGNCDPDHGSIRSLLINNFDVAVDRVMFVPEALAALRSAAYALVLVNRQIFTDGSEGLPLITTMKADTALAATPVMMISNFPDAQQRAVAAGAVHGFGKAAIGKPETIALLGNYLPSKRSAAATTGARH